MKPGTMRNKMRPSNVKYPGQAKIDKRILRKYDKGSGVNLDKHTSRIKNPVQRQKLRVKENAIVKSIKATARTEVLLTESSGCLEGDPGETTTHYKQKQIVDNVDLTSAAKHFTLDLEFGPYSVKYTRNGRHLLLGGKKGHVAAFDWVTKKLACEINVMESVHDVAWLHVETMFAVAQKDWVYIYDNQGIELHCLKKMYGVNCLEFLPYHFLLTSASKNGYLSWLDVSIGEFVAQYSTNLGRISVMTQNPNNGLLCVGGATGVVSMWSPNTREPLAKMLCHNQAVSACTVHPYGIYMATTSRDRSVKVWDIRQLAGPVHNCILPAPAQHISYCQRYELAMGIGNVVEIYRQNKSEMVPYMRHKAAWMISDMQFCPYEDVLGIATAKGFSSLLVPGSGEPNFDALESNPFQTKSQRREAEVKALLDKIPAELITLDPLTIADVDVPTLKDEVQENLKLKYIKPKDIDFKSHRTKVQNKGTVKVLKSKKIQKEMSRREAIEALHQESAKRNAKKTEGPHRDYGVLNRFVSKTGKRTRQ